MALDFHWLAENPSIRTSCSSSSTIRIEVVEGGKVENEWHVPVLVTRLSDPPPLLGSPCFALR